MPKRRERRVEIHPAAVRELERAQDWYLERNPEAAFRFNDRVWNSIAAVQRNPEIFAPFFRDFRRVVVVKFPYLVIFRLVGDVVSVVAVAHAKRKSLYWSRRRRP